MMADASSPGVVGRTASAYPDAADVRGSSIPVLQAGVRAADADAMQTRVSRAGHGNFDTLLTLDADAQGSAIAPLPIAVAQEEPPNIADLAASILDQLQDQAAHAQPGLQANPGLHEQSPMRGTVPRSMASPGSPLSGVGNRSLSTADGVPETALPILPNAWQRDPVAGASNNPLANPPASMEPRSFPRAMSGGDVSRGATEHLTPATAPGTGVGPGVDGVIGNDATDAALAANAFDAPPEHVDSSRLNGVSPYTPPTPATSGALAPAPPVAAATVAQPADPNAGYDDSFGAQVTWLAGQRIGEAQIRVSPDHLGAIDIHLQLDGDQVRAEFHSMHVEVRQTLEASLPRLRELLGQQGLQLAHAGVGQERSRHDGGGPHAAAPGDASTPDEHHGPVLPAFRRGRGLIDVYA